jgi:carboxyl-terminal processing protease
VEYKDGEPVDIPDDKRETFYTSRGRPVLDGGGVTPDVKLETTDKPEILQELRKEHWIFKYVNDYVAQESEVPEVGTFTFTDYDGFQNFLDKENFQFESKTQKKLEELLDDSESSLTSDLEKLIKQVANRNSDDLVEFKEEIIRDLEIEIIKRYHFQKGKAQQNLKSDPEIQEAITLLESPAAYRQILNK